MSSAYHPINNNGTNIVDILNTWYTKSEINNIIPTSHIKTKTGNLLNLKVSTSGSSAIQGD